MPKCTTCAARRAYQFCNAICVRHQFPSRNTTSRWNVKISEAFYRAPVGEYSLNFENWICDESRSLQYIGEIHMRIKHVRLSSELQFSKKFNLLPPTASRWHFNNAFHMKGKIESRVSLSRRYFVTFTMTSFVFTHDKWELIRWLFSLFEKKAEQFECCKTKLRWPHRHIVCRIELECKREARLSLSLSHTMMHKVNICARLWHAFVFRILISSLLLFFSFIGCRPIRTHLAVSLLPAFGVDWSLFQPL